MITAGVLGATGYMGSEVIRVLLQHPDIEIAWLASRKEGLLEDYHPNFYGLDIKLVHPDKIFHCDIVFVALPTAASLDIFPRLLDMDCRVIDLGAALRLSSKDTWEDVYQQAHNQWHLATEAVYGLSEHYYDEIKSARLIANPGCFSSAAILGLAPLVKEQIVEPATIVVNGLSGTAGMGVELSRAAHHPEIGNNLVPYNVVDHRHSYEMEQELSVLINDVVRVHFTPVYVPVTRGILAVCHAFTIKEISRENLLEIYRNYYQGHPFVKIFDALKEESGDWQYKPYPWVSVVSGTNYCYIGLDVDIKRNRVVIFSVLDNMGKGGAHAGIENMNIMFNLDRKAGLTCLGRHPA